MSETPVKILLIEDNPGDARLIREMLADAKGVRADLEWADRLTTGLERLAVGGIDVVLLDLALPDSQGLDTFARTHARAPDVAIVVLTGLDDESLAVEAMGAGAQDYLVKGQADGNLLVRSMRYAIERKRAEEATRQAEALRAVMRLAHAAAHEIHNPLMVIVGRLQMLARQLESVAPSHRQIEQALGSAWEIRNIISRMERIVQLESYSPSPGPPEILDLEKSSGNPEAGEPEC